jgi:hypothetical protein
MYGYIENDGQYRPIEILVPQDVESSVIWPIPFPVTPIIISTAPAAVVSLSRKQRYSITKAAMYESMGLERQAQLQMNTWDDVAVQSVPQQDYYKDQIYDEHLALFFIPTAWDNDSENQLQQMLWSMEVDVQDPRSVLIITPTVINLGWDNDSENQIPQIFNFSDWIGERNVLPIIATVPDNDSDQQIKQLNWYQDQVDERNVLPIIPPVGWDADTANQSFWFNLVSYETIDLIQVSIFPIIIPFIMGTGSVVSTITAIGNSTGIQAVGIIQPLIDVDGELIP